MLLRGRAASERVDDQQRTAGRDRVREATQERLGDQRRLEPDHVGDHDQVEGARGERGVVHVPRQRVHPLRERKRARAGAEHLEHRRQVEAGDRRVGVPLGDREAPHAGAAADVEHAARRDRQLRGELARGPLEHGRQIGDDVPVGERTRVGVLVHEHEGLAGLEEALHVRPHLEREARAARPAHDRLGHRPHHDTRPVATDQPEAREDIDHQRHRPRIEREATRERLVFRGVRRDLGEQAGPERGGDRGGDAEALELFDRGHSTPPVRS
ncbi:MAG: hypothetical protein U0325_33645 [Polyangiales bacterium]